MHINYFGDILLFSGLALITQSLSLLVIPFIMTLNFIFFLIPSLDKYLEKKYRYMYILQFEYLLLILMVVLVALAYLRMKIRNKRILDSWEV